jgi:hypothetical protein
MKQARVIVFLCSTFSVHITTAQELITYPAPKAVIYSMHNDDYTVRVRKPGGEWQDVFEYKVKVDMDKVQEASMVSFDFAGAVEVSVRKNNENIQSVRIRPAVYGVTPDVNGNVITFMLTEPRKLSVEFNGDKLHNLHVFANGVEEKRPDPNDPNVIYFGPGVHTPAGEAGGSYKIPSGKTVYLEGSAIVRAKLVCDSVNNIKICGRGMLDQPPQGVQVSYSTNVEIDGIIILNPRHYTVLGGASRNLIIRDIKSFSCQGWGDGIDLMSCSDVTVDGVFMRNSDDCIAVYGHRWNYFGGSSNITVMNSTLWADIAHPINIGIHGNTRMDGDTLENMVFRNIDILEHDEDDPEYQGCMAINAGDCNLVRNIRYENIRVDDFEEGQLFNLRVVYNKQYNTGPGKGIENIHFKDILYTGTLQSFSHINGLDSGHGVKGVTFENVRVNGKVVVNAASGNIKTGEFVQDIIFKK